MNLLRVDMMDRFEISHERIDVVKSDLVAQMDRIHMRIDGIRIELGSIKSEVVEFKNDQVLTRDMIVRIERIETKVLA